MVPVAQVLACPLELDFRVVQTTLASVFNRDVSPDTDLVEAEVLSCIVYRVLLKSGFAADDITAILRHCREDLEEFGLELRRSLEYSSHWGAITTGTSLQILDQRYAGTNRGGARCYDFKERKVVPWPKQVLLSLAIALPTAFVLVVGTGRDSEYCRSVKAAVEAGELTP